MKTLLAAFVLLASSLCLPAQTSATSRENAHAEGILQSIRNASVAVSGDALQLTRTDPHMPVTMIFQRCQALGVHREQNQWWLLPIAATGAHIAANRALWVLPIEAASKDRSWHIEFDGASANATKADAGLTVVIDAANIALRRSEPRPHSDPFGHRFAIRIAGGAELEDALAGFYWGTMLPSVVEKTMAAAFPYSSGYVLSTLNVNSYAGSYPAVEHEFQIKGRLAMGSEADLDVARRMIELQFQLMRDDPEQLHRAPTSVQPDGRREYHVRRSSMDNRENAAMFPLTGNIEVLEEAWHYYEARKDLAWLRAHISNLEDAATWTLASVDPYGRVWSDVYYEDQVMKDGRETESQAFAAYTFDLLARMEGVLGRQQKSVEYSAVAKKIAKALLAPLPTGYWDASNQRFIDWVDRNGAVHDHLPLLANTLPVTFGYAPPPVAAAVGRTIDRNAAQYERFPSFLSADIAGYTPSEIGNGGPYDLSAAGRYWYWDAAYRQSQKQNEMLFHQLQAVAAEAAKDNYFMGERYDMDHVYYIDGKNAHGAEKYYEYPNVFAAVLISKFLGLSATAGADLSVTPEINSYGTVEFATPQYGLRYTHGADGFTLKNLAARPRRFQVDLAALNRGVMHYMRKTSSGSQRVGPLSTVTLAAQEEAHWTPQK